MAFRTVIEPYAVSYCGACEVEWNPESIAECWLCEGEGTEPRGPETEEKKAEQLLLRLTRLNQHEAKPKNK